MSEKELAIKELIAWLELFKGHPDAQAMALQSHIAKHGPIPNEYGEEIKALIGDEK